MLYRDVQREPFAEASHFREDFYGCLTARRDELCALADALLCADGPVTSPVELTLVAEHRRGHGALYDALNRGRLDAGRLRRTLAAPPQPKAADDRLVLTVDVSNWLRPEAECSAERLLCHTYGRGRDQHVKIPGWPYSFFAALESGRNLLVPAAGRRAARPRGRCRRDHAVQVCRVVEDLVTGGRWREGEPDVLVVFDAGYDAPRMAHLLDGRPVEALGRMRSDHVMRRPTPTQLEYANAYPQGGRPPKHGKECRFARSENWGEPDAATVQITDRYGTAKAMAWDRLRPTGSPPAPRGSTMTVNSSSSRGRCSAWRSTVCPAAETPCRCGCGPPPPP
ncbi:transposase [Streptomyces uncialis]|uniref:transposase n=1 Tax=Streptomyces uncialis TaxID=1048205 RepID=UPI003810A974